MRSNWIRAGMVACALAVGVSAATAKPADNVWNALAEFKLTPNQANPSPDHHGRPNVWHYMEGPSSGAHNPATYTLYTEFVFDGCYQAGWRSPDHVANTPFVAVNTCPLPRVVVHPGGSRNTILAWQAQITGTVGVSGSVADDDNSCGNGIEWWIDDGSTNLASGSIAEGGSQNFSAGTGGASLADFAVTVGDFVYLIVGSKQSDFVCDATTVSFVVTQNTPTAVVIRNLTARQTAAGVAVTWRTAAETAIAGFHLWRTEGRAAKKVTRVLIPTKGGGTYRFVDRTARRGTAYLYRLQSVGLDGTRTWRGTVRVAR